MISIKDNYLALKYDESIGTIKSLVKQLKSLLNEEKLKESVEDKILRIIQNQNQKEGDVYKHYSRRFFENRLFQLYMGNIEDLSGINKIIEFSMGYKVDSTKDLEATSNFKFNGRRDSKKKMEELQYDSKLYRSKDAPRKTGIASSMTEVLGRKGESIYSKNLGIMTSLTPNFYDELSENEMRNRVLDTRTVGDESKYSNINKRIPFAGSLSGHVYFDVVILEKYMKKYQEEHAKDKDPKHAVAILNADINDFVKAVMAGFVSRGYHSYFELLDILTDTKVKAMFERFGVTIDTSFEKNKNILLEAFKDAQEYSKMVCLRKAARDAISDSKFIITKLQETLHDSIVNKPINDGSLLDIESCLQKGFLPSNEDKLILLKKVEAPNFILHYLVKNNYPYLIDYFLKNGADINKQNDEHYTPLDTAVKYSQIDIALNLAAKGANFLNVTESEFSKFMSNCLSLSSSLPPDKRNVVMKMFFQYTDNKDIENHVQLYDGEIIDEIIKETNMMRESKECKDDKQLEKIIGALIKEEKRQFCEEFAEHLSLLSDLIDEEVSKDVSEALNTLKNFCEDGNFESLLKTMKETTLSEVLSNSSKVSDKMVDVTRRLFQQSYSFYKYQDSRLVNYLVVCQLLIDKFLNKEGKEIFNKQCSDFLSDIQSPTGKDPMVALAKMAETGRLVTEEKIADTVAIAAVSEVNTNLIRPKF